MRRAWKIAFYTALTLAVLAVLLLVSAIAVFRSDWFRNMVRDRIVTEVQKASGGRVEIAGFDYSWNRFTANVTGFVLHGIEPNGSPPLFRADRIHVRLRVVSFLERKADILALVVDRPQIHIYVHGDGTTNLPTPPDAARARGNVIADILNLRIRHLELRNGVATYNSENMPLDVRADDVMADLRYSAGSSPRGAQYSGKISAGQMHLSARAVNDATFDFTTRVVVERARILIQDARLRSAHSTVAFSGSVTDLSSPRANLEVTSRLLLADFAKSMKLPVADRGEIALSGKAEVSFAPFRYVFDGRLNGRDLAYSTRQLRLPNLAVSSNVKVTADRIELTNVDAAALGGHFRGSARIEGLNRFELNGKAEGISAAQVARLNGEPSSELNGTASGAVEATGSITEKGIEDIKAHANLEIARGATGVPVEGSVSVAYDQHNGAVQLGNSNLTIGTSQFTATGTLGQTLSIHVSSRNLHDLELALPLTGKALPRTIPVKLIGGGTARFDGTIGGSLNSPIVDGQLQLGTFEVHHEIFNRLAAGFDATPGKIDVRTLTLDGDALHATASGRLTGLADWQPQPRTTVQGSVTIRGADVAKLLAQNGYKYPVSGTLSSSVTISGTYAAPQLTGYAEVDNAVAYDQIFSRVLAGINYRAGRLDMIGGRAHVGQAEADFSGVYNHSGADWTSGQLTFKVFSRGVSLPQIAVIAERWHGVEGQLNFDASGTAHFIHGDLDLDDLDSRIALHKIVIEGDALGDLNATAKTRGQILDVEAQANLSGAEVHGQGEWHLTGDYPGQAQITIPHVELKTIKDLLPVNSSGELPFGGFLSASANVSVPLKKLDAVQADATISHLQINASSTAQPRAGAEAKDLILRNAEPLQFEITSKTISIRSARFTGTDTTIQASGRVGFDNNEPWNLRVNGSVNLAILQLFNHDLLASGSSIVNATVRGPLKAPEVNGRMELRNASLYIADLPNGVEKANGVILFDRNRATVERLSGESGGGNVTFEAGSFLGFSSDLLIYHAQAIADHVRYRSPDGLSVTANANLSLSGTSERSTLAGAVTVTRAAFSPQTDVGSLIASFAKPVAVPINPNAYVRGIQFDVRIDTAQNLEVLTSLTRDIEADANLRLRGNVDRPILLGTINVTQGEIDFFGNKYRINRGDLDFNNPAKIEPVIDMDMETRVRGIIVDITFAGPLNKMSFSYRSDPPLESSQIIALLAVGRQPVGLGGLANSPTNTDLSYLATGTNGILQQAITAPVSGRLERFFGVSHIKIDPQLTDITSVPQARLSFEQQISKDVTLTYITNLSRTSEQIVRVEWDLTRRWSVVAVRDENGLFGMDLQYRKSFK